MKKYISRMRGVEKSPARKPLSEVAWSWLGAFVGIYAISLLGKYFQFSGYDQILLVGSFGASAVLIYGAPRVEYAQPRNLVGGHLVSAIVGVTAYKVISFDTALAGAVAVSVAIVIMHLSKTLHPPGGATALIAVIGSSHVHELGYMYVLSPIASGILVMLLVALIVNNVSANPRRHYPVFWL